MVVPLVLQLAPVRSVVDVGCGWGAWLRVFLDFNVSTACGMDGGYVDRSRLLIDPASFHPKDLAQPFAVGGSYDLATCLEVAEHLPPSAGRGLIEALTRAAPLVLFSAAPPGQGGVHHVNEQWPAYWRALFAEHGFERLDPIRPRTWRNADVEWYYRQNMFLYAHVDAIASSAVLQEERRISEEADFELVRSSVLGRYASLSGLLREIPGAIARALRRRLAGASPRSPGTRKAPTGRTSSNAWNGTSDLDVSPPATSRRSSAPVTVASVGERSEPAPRVESATRGSPEEQAEGTR